METSPSLTPNTAPAPDLRSPPGDPAGGGPHATHEPRLRPLRRSGQTATIRPGGHVTGGPDNVRSGTGGRQRRWRFTHRRRARAIHGPRRTARRRRGAGRLCDLAALRQPDDSTSRPLPPPLLSELPAGDVDDRKLDDVYAVAVVHLALARVRAPSGGPCAVAGPRARRLALAALGAAGRHGDMQSSTTRCAWCPRQGLGVHLFVHPMPVVERDERYRLINVAPGNAAKTSLVEAWTQIEIDRIDDATARTTSKPR